MAEKKITKQGKKKTTKQEEIEMKEFEKKVEDTIKCKIKEGIQCNGTGGCAYFLGFLGALIYYVTTAPTFWEAVVGFLKALVWPAIIVYEALKFLGL